MNVESSNLSTRSARLAQLVEHYLDTAGVTGSSPVLRTIFLVSPCFRILALACTALIRTNLAKTVSECSQMRIQKTLNHGNTQWRVTISLHGKRRQRFFTSRDEVRAWLNSIEADSTDFWSNRIHEEQRDIVSTYNLASKLGVSTYQCMLNSPAKLTPLSITDAVGKYVEVIKRRGSSILED